MAKLISARVSVALSVTLELDEPEVAALDGIFGYNVDAFLKVFYERMGEAYVKPHERGVRSLHAKIRGLMAGPLRTVKTAREAVHNALEI